MSIEVTAAIKIGRARGEVAVYATDASNDPLWIGGVVESGVLSDGPVRQGTRVARVAKFLGRRIEYVNEVIEYDPGVRLVMKSVSGPFPMTISYEFEEAEGGTLTRIHVRGEAEGFFKLAAPVLARFVRRSIMRDLGTLKGLLEMPKA